MKKIKDIINKTWGIFINNFKVLAASMLVSLFWVVFLTVDEVKDAETEIKIRMENAILTNKVDLLLSDRNQLLKINTDLQGIIQRQNLLIIRAQDIIQKQKEAIDDLYKKFYSTSWASK